MAQDSQKLYTYWWSIADADKDGVLGQQDSLNFFARSGLQMPILAHIWKQVNPSDTPNLQPSQFILACQMIGLAQSGVEPSMSQIGLYLGSQRAIPIPTFQGIPPPPTPQLFKWEVSSEQAQQALMHFQNLDLNRSGFINGQQAASFIKQSGLPQDVLSQIWTLSDVSADGRLDLKEFCLTVFLVQTVTTGNQIIVPLPVSLIHSIWTNVAPNPCPQALKYAYPNVTPINPAIFATNNPTSSPRTSNPVFNTNTSNNNSNNSNNNNIFNTATKSSTGIAPSLSPRNLTSPSPVKTTSIDWKPTDSELTTFGQFFQTTKSPSGFVEKEQGRTFFLQSGIDDTELFNIFTLSDIDKDSRLSLSEFLIAMKLIKVKLSGEKLPGYVPHELLIACTTFKSSEVPVSNPTSNANATPNLPPPPINSTPTPTNYSSHSDFSLETEYIEAKAKIGNLQRELQLAEDNFSVIQSKYRTTESELKFVKERLASVEEILKKKDLEAQNRNNANQQQVSNELKQAQARINQLEAQLEEKDIYLQKSRTEYASSIETQNKLLEKERANKIDTVTELQQAQDRLRHSDQHIRSLESKVQDLERQLADSKKSTTSTSSTYSSYCSPSYSSQPTMSSPTPTSLPPVQAQNNQSFSYKEVNLSAPVSSNSFLPPPINNGGSQMPLPPDNPFASGANPWL